MTFYYVVGSYLISIMMLVPIYYLLYGMMIAEYHLHPTLHTWHLEILDMIYTFSILFFTLAYTQGGGRRNTKVRTWKLR